MGTGKNYSQLEEEVINKSPEYKLKDLRPFEAFKFIDNYDKILTIYVPKHFKNNYTDQVFKKFNINLVHANRNELPQIVKDFVRCLDIKSVTKPQDISIPFGVRIKIFNYNIVKRLDNLFWPEKPQKPIRKKI